MATAGAACRTYHRAAMKISTRQLQAFLTAAELQSFTKAAEILHVTQAGLSSMVQELEGQVGHRLFTRSPRRVALTDAGLHFLPHARDAMGALDNGLVELATFERRMGGGIRVAVSPALATSLIPAVVGRFCEQTGIACEIVDTELDNFGALIDGDHVDAAYTNSPIASRSQRVEPLFSAHTVMAVPAGWHADVRAISAEADWAPFRQARRFVLPARNAFQRSVDRLLLQARAPEMQQQELQHLATILAFVGAGQGIGFAPRFMLAQHGGVRAISLPDRLSAVAFFCITRGDRPVLPQVRRFSALLAEAGEG